MSRYALLSQLADLACARVNATAMLEAAAHTIAPALAIDALLLVGIEGNSLRFENAFFSDVPRYDGDSLDAYALRALRPHRRPSMRGEYVPIFPLKGSATEYAGKTGIRWFARPSTMLRASAAISVCDGMASRPTSASPCSWANA